MRRCTTPPKPLSEACATFTVLYANLVNWTLTSFGFSLHSPHFSEIQISSWITCRNPNDPHASSPNRTISHSTATVGRAPARHGGWRGLRDRARTLEYAARDTRYESWRSVRFGSRRPSADGACPASAVLPDRHFCLPQVQRGASDPADLACNFFI